MPAESSLFATTRPRARGGKEMNWTSTTPLRVGQVIEISFATFTLRIIIRADREPTVEVIAGAYLGFSDTVVYEVGSAWPRFRSLLLQ